LELAYHGIKLFLIRSWLPVDVRDNQARFQPLQVSERAGAYRLDHHTGSMDAGDRCRRGILHDHAEFGFTSAATVVLIVFGLRVVEIGEDLVTIADGHGGILRFAIAHVAQTDTRTGSAAGDFVYEIV